jgi:hypothetical protein
MGGRQYGVSLVWGIEVLKNCRICFRGVKKIFPTERVMVRIFLLQKVTFLWSVF